MEFDLNNAFILVHFFEENKFSVLRLKKSVELDKNLEICKWDPSKKIDVLWHGTTYPGYILQFGGKFYIFGLF